MNCTGCAHENPSGAKFCEECGTALARACANCGTELRAGIKFCSECGTAVTASGAADSPPGPGSPRPPTAASPAPSSGTRKIVTIVFADLVGSTALHERLDPESARLFMESYYDAAREVVESHGGTVTQLLGDGVKAVFGIPRVAEDDAIRAVRAAVAMQEGFRALAEQQRGAVGATGLRVAVNTGEVVAKGGSEIIGDPVNVAARLQEQGRDGDVVVGDSTARLVEALVTLAPLGSFALKGRAEEVAAFRVESLEPPAGAAAAAFVGRDEELARITAVYETAVEKPATHLAVLLGSPGLGKSRLIDEFGRRLGETASVVAAQCDDASSATFAPLAEALREQLGIEAGVGGEELHAATLAAIPGDDAERARVAAGIAALLAGSPASPEETFFVVRRLFAALASVRPVVLVIDDLQWAEPLLLDLVEHLVQWGSGLPLLVLVGARPELRGKRSSLVAPGGLVADVVTLAGLDAGAAMRLAANVIGAADLPAAVAAKVLAASEGNPLFVGELVRMLVHEGALKREGDRWTTGTALAALEMPPTIHALLAARIERLHPEERVVLERAAVVGRHFSRSAVAELLPGDLADLDARLESLRHTELIERDTGWFFGEPVLRFHHALIRDAAYRQLLKGTRAELHTRFADWALTRTEGSIEHDEIIGWHLEQAHQHLSELGPIDAQGREIGERASTHLAAAGGRALDGDDVSLAAGLLGRAIERLDPDDPARGELALDWCEALLAAGDVGPAAGAIDELERFVGDSERLRAWHTCFAGEHQVLTAPEGLPATADAVAGAAEAMAAQGDAAGEAKAHFVHALVFRRLGKIGACEAALDRALAAARRIAGDRRRANAVLAIAPLAALWGPSPVTRASGRCLDVVRVLRITQGAPAVEAVALSCQGVLEALRGRTDAARRMIASSRDMVEELGITQRLLEVDVFSGLVDLLEGDAVAAERSLRTAYDGMRELGLGIDAARAAAQLARALLAQDRVAEAEALSNDSEALAGDDLKAAIAWRGVRAEALARRGEHAAAVEFASKAVEIAAATDALLDHADARLALAAALRAAGRAREADAEERRAHELWEAKGATLLAERARSEGAPLEPVGDAEAPITPAPVVRRGVRPNGATAMQARFDAAVAARDMDALRAQFSDSHREVDHPTGSTYGPDQGVASMQRLLRSRDPYYEVVPLATLGESLMLGRRRTGASGAVSRHYDVGSYENCAMAVFEADERGLMSHSEAFSADRLNDAIACLYERYAQLSPEGPSREHAQMVARSIATIVVAAGDLERLAPLLAPDFESVDHRHLSTWSLSGAAVFLEHMHALQDVADEIDIRADDILALEPSALLIRRMHSGTERVGGGAYERLFLVLFATGPDGRLARAEWFDADREAEALARFDELTTSARRTTPFANAASRGAERLLDSWRARDWQRMAELLPAGYRLYDRRRMVLLDLDRDDFLESVRVYGEMESTRLESELIATRGDRLALCRNRLELAGGDIGPSELENFTLTEMDDRGDPITQIRFDLEEEDAAYAELNARYDADESTANPQCWRSILSFVHSVAAREWDAVAELCAPELVEYDHRGLAVLGTTRGGKAWAENFRTLVELTSDTIYRVHHFLPEAHGYYVHGGWYGKQDGGDYEMPLNAVLELDEHGLIIRADIYDDSVDAALARLAELAGPVASPSPLTNSVVRASERNMAAWVAKDWERFAQAYPADFHLSDRRHTVQLELDREEMIDFSRSLGELNTTRIIQSETIATRGDRLALVRRRIEASGDDVGPSEFVHLNLFESDEHGVLTAIVRWDSDELDAAYAELEARFAAGEAAAHPLALAAYHSGMHILEARDWRSFQAAFAADFVLYDHRLLGWGTLRGAAEFTRTQQALIELAPDTRWRIEHAETAERGLLLSVVAYGTRDGGPFELAFIRVNELDEAGKTCRGDLYDPDHQADARARFAAIGAREASEPLASIAKPNAASAAMDRWLASYDIGFDTGEWDALRGLCAEECMFEDRRRIALLAGDRELMIASARERAAMGARAHLRPVGMAGDLIGIGRMLWSGGPPDGRFEIEYLCVYEIDRSGLFTAFVLVDIDDPREAQREAWARWAAIEPHVAAVVTPLGEALDAFNEQSASRWRSVFTDDLVVEDHRHAGMGRIDGADAYVSSIEALWEIAPVTRAEAGWVWSALARHGAITVLRRTGTVPDGGEFESEYLYLHLVSQGRITRVEMFELDALDEALAHFEALNAAPLPGTPNTNAAFANAATRTVDCTADALAARDWERLSALFATEFRSFDQRAAVQLESDREPWLAAYRQIVEMTSARPHPAVLATRGERLAIVQMKWRGTAGDIGPSEIDWLLVIEVDERGDHLAAVTFDLEGLDAAYAELDTRWATGEAALHPQASAWLAGFQRAFANRDWEALAALSARNQVAVNHRLVGWGTLRGPRAWVPTVEALVELAPDARLRIDHVRTCERGLLYQCAWLGTRDGGAFETPHLVVMEHDEQGRQIRMDVWDDDKLDVASERFEALAASAPARPQASLAQPNAAHAAMARWAATFKACAGGDDWAPMRALYAADAAFEDRQRLSQLAGDLEMQLASMRERGASGAGPARKLIGTAGDRIVIERVLWSGGPSDGRFEIEHLALVEIDAAELFTATVLFDPDDTRAAQREAWTRWATIDPAAAPWARLFTEVTEAWNSQDKARVRALFANDVVVEDHRHAGLGRIEGADAYVESNVALWELAPDQQIEFGGSWVATDSHAALVLLRREGTLADGGPFENDYLWLGLAKDGVFTGLELFEIEALDAALTRFEELCTEASDRGESR